MAPHTFPRGNRISTSITWWGARLGARFLLGWLAWLGCQAASSAEDEPLPAPPQGAVRVMTLNIRMATPADGRDAWTHRKERVAEVVKRNRVDVFAAQEALRPQVADLEKLLADYAWYGVGREDGQEKGEYAPVFFRKDRFTATDQGTFWLSPTPNEPGSKGWDAAVTRIASWVRLADKSTGQSFVVFSTHLDHQGETARRESAKMLLARVRELGGESAVVLAGDFNSTEDGAPYKTLTAARAADAKERAEDKSKEKDDKAWLLADARKVSAAPHEGPDSTWNGFRAIVPRRRIDFVFVRPTIKVLAHRILDPRREGRFISDHLPIVADLALPKGR